MGCCCELGVVGREARGSLRGEAGPAVPHMSTSIHVAGTRCGSLYLWSTPGDPDPAGWEPLQSDVLMIPKHHTAWPPGGQEAALSSNSESSEKSIKGPSEEDWEWSGEPTDQSTYSVPGAGSC